MKAGRLDNYKGGIYECRLSVLYNHIMECDLLKVRLEKAGRLYLKSTRGHQPRRINSNYGMNYDTSDYVR